MTGPRMGASVVMIAQLVLILTNRAVAQDYRESYGQPAQSSPANMAQHPGATVHVAMKSAGPHASAPPVHVQVVPPIALQSDFDSWWQPAAARPLRESHRWIAVDINSLIVDALRYSARVRAISDNIVIADTAITRADAEFDVHSFMESKMVRTSVPTGSALDAGLNVSRLQEEDWFYRVGLRRKNNHGGRIEIAQRIGTRDSNSEFFSPLNQGNSRLTLSYNQPLLNGGGQAYNSSLIVLADLESFIAEDRTAAELQDELLAVTESMWELYVQRSLLLQRQRHLDRGKTIHERLTRRRDVDALDSQIARARAAVTMREAELIRAHTAIRNAESRLRALVNSPTLLDDRTVELVPIQLPLRSYVPVDLQGALVMALKNRPDVDAAAQELEAARIRLNVARNELLPALNVVLESYVSGLQGNFDIGQSWVDQFSVGQPSYTAGIVLEAPIHRRAARAVHQRRQAELRQLSNRFQAQLETVNADVEVAVREVETTFREMRAKYESMLAAQSDEQYLQRRWESLPGNDGSASFLLADLLDAQDRLAFAEFDFTRAQVAYTLSLTHLNRATGTLLKHEQIEMIRECDHGMPTVRFEKREAVEELQRPGEQLHHAARQNTFFR